MSPPRVYIRQVIALCFENAFVLTTHQIIIDNRIYDCAFNTHIYAHVDSNVVDHP